MADKTTNYQCPACTGPLHFVGSSGRLECEYCGSSYSVEEIEAMYGEKNDAAAAAQTAEEAKAAESIEIDELSDWDTAAIKAWSGSSVRAYNCTSCGAELICDDTTAATECPYCGNPTIIPAKLTGALKPDYIIPFKLSKEDAMNSLRRHYGNKKLLPRLFSEENHIEKVQGVYVPFWLYNGRAAADVRYSAERIVTFRTRSEEVTETSFYELFRSGHLDFENIPVDASEKINNELMDSIEPYDYSELKPFSMSYLPGYFADRYDREAAECSKRADERAENTILSVLRDSTTEFMNVRERDHHIRLGRGKAHYALMPVWILNTHWNDEDYIFAMNGQTGKFVGDLPSDKALERKWHLIYGGILSAVFLGISVLMYLL